MKARPISPRKTPRQERARATVDVILQAAAYILKREGWAGLTTNHVADRAGVNIASVYQYFPNKSAIVEALRRAHVEQTRRALMAACAESADPVAAMIRALVAAHRVSPVLHRIFTEELPGRATAQDSECSSEPELMSRLLPLLKGCPNPELTLFVARSAVHAVIHEAVCHRPEMLSHPAFEAELIRLLRACLGLPNQTDFRS